MLLELQESLHRKVRAVAKAHHQDILAARANPDRRWRATPLPPEVNEEEHAAGIRVNLLRERVLDDQVRALCQGLSAEAAAIELTRSEDEGNTQMDVIVAIYEATNEHLGTVLRGLL